MTIWRALLGALLVTMLGCSEDSAESGAGGSACTPFEASSETVTASNSFGTLEGTLERPAGCGAIPVVLMISGSASQDRDGDSPGSPSPIQLTRVLGEALRTQADVATLRYDDPGVGGSATAIPANLEEFLFDHEIESASAFIEVVRADRRFSSVIVAGHSMGSLVGIVADQTTPIDGFISLAGAGRLVSDLLREQLSDDLTPAQYQELDEALKQLEAGELAGPVNPPLDQIIPPVYQPYFISWLQYHPAEEIAAMTAPALIVQGRTDIQVTVGDAEALAAAKPDATLVLVDDMAHTLKQATSSNADQNAAYTDPNVPLAAGLMPPIVTFLEPF